MTENMTQEAPVEDVPEPAVEPAIHLRLRQFIALRDKIEADNKAHDVKMKPLKDALATLNNMLLEHLNVHGGDSFTVRGVGTCYKTVKSSASIADGAEFRRFVIGGGLWDMLDWKANVPAVAAFAEEQNMLPPGVNLRRVAVVGVRRES